MNDGPPDPPPTLPTPHLRLIHFPKAEQEELQPEGGLVIPGKSIVPADCIAPLKQALASAQAGHVAALAIAGVLTDGSEMFFVASNDTTFSEILGALEIVKATVVDAALEHYEISNSKPKG